MLFPGNRIIIFNDGAVNKCNIDLENQIKSNMFYSRAKDGNGETVYKCYL